MADINDKSHIEIRAGVRGERAFVAGHRVRVQDVVLWNEEGLTAEEIVSRVPTISLADVHAALAFYFDHQADIDRQIREDQEYVDQQQMAEADLSQKFRREA